MTTQALGIATSQSFAAWQAALQNATANPNDWIAQEQVKNAEAAFKTTAALYNTARANDRADSAEARAAAKAAVGGGDSGWASIASAQISADTQRYLGELQHQVAMGRLSLDEASEEFNQYLKNAELKLARQTQYAQNVNTANSMYADNARWAVPPGMENFPGFEPGGPLSVVARMVGAKYTPPPITRVPFDPVGDVREIYSGRYDNPDLPITVKRGQLTTPVGGPATAPGPVTSWGPGSGTGAAGPAGPAQPAEPPAKRDPRIGASLDEYSAGPTFPLGGKNYGTPTTDADWNLRNTAPPLMAGSAAALGLDQWVAGQGNDRLSTDPSRSAPTGNVVPLDQIIAQQLAQAYGQAINPTGPYVTFDPVSGNFVTVPASGPRPMGGSAPAPTDVTFDPATGNFVRAQDLSRSPSSSVVPFALPEPTLRPTNTQPGLGTQSSLELPPIQPVQIGNPYLEGAGVGVGLGMGVDPWVPVVPSPPPSNWNDNGYWETPVPISGGGGGSAPPPVYNDNGYWEPPAIPVTGGDTTPPVWNDNGYWEPPLQPADPWTPPPSAPPPVWNDNGYWEDPSQPVDTWTPPPVWNDNGYWEPAAPSYDENTMDSGGWLY
jgi:hypothetical protein